MIQLKKRIASKVSDVVSALYAQEVAVELTIPDENFGDFSTNVAMQLAGLVAKSPSVIADEIITKLSEDSVVATKAGPGFINISVTDADLWNSVLERKVDIFNHKTYVVEYSCPNYFKELHAGHLYQTLVGDVIARLIERAGAKVHRTNFGGDVGQHVARAMWAILQDLGAEDIEALKGRGLENASAKATYISERYVQGSQAYESDEKAKAEIETLNKRIYELHKSGDKTSDLAQIYFTCREWSKEYFVKLYQDLKVTEFERYYPESETESLGATTVRVNIDNGTFKNSQGAVVFEGEKYGLHTRVFITKDGLPTYEAKDLGLILMELDAFKFDHRILITGRDQAEYMKVVWRAIDQIVSGIESKMTHLTNGIIKFGDGTKMSSRLGNVTTAMDVLQVVRELVGSSGDPKRDEQIVLGAVKYEFLRHRLGGDIAFDPNASVSLIGDSGPYLQYAQVRAQKIIEQCTIDATTEMSFDNAFNSGERSLVRKLAEYQLVLEKATKEYLPHYICVYLYELAQEFNRFYENNRVVGGDNEDVRFKIVNEYRATLRDGLFILGIEAPDKM